MNAPAVPGSGPYLQGTLVPSPADTIPARDVRAHAFFNVLRNVVQAVGAFSNEEALDGALKSLADFEKDFLQTSLRHVTQEHDPAPKEDVRLRVPPQVGYSVVPAAGPGIDYNKLAAAIVAMQQQANQPPPPDEEGPTE